MTSLTHFFQFSTAYDGYLVNHGGEKHEFKLAEDAEKYMLQNVAKAPDEIDYSISEWFDGTWLIIRA